MPKTQKRKYVKIDEAEIDLVIKCNDSHEFYEQYRQVFPNKKKGIDSISKIWKRRSEFLKKMQPEEPPIEIPVGASREMEDLISAQNKILADMFGVMKEHLKASKEILAHLSKHNQRSEDSVPKHSETRIPENKEPAKKSCMDKPAEIMIGS